MEFVLQVVAWAIAVPLEVLIIAALLQGHYRRYPFFFVYSIGNFLTTVVDISLKIAVYSRLPGAKGVWVLWYWVDEGIMQGLVFALVISLVYHATKNIKSRRMVRASLVIGAFLFAGISFLIHYSPRIVLSAWMTPWSRDLSFCSTILDLALWAMLIGSREKDRRLLLLSGSLGIQFTSAAIGEAIRTISGRTGGVFAGDFLMLVANLGVLYIWWRTFRQPPSKEERAK